MFNNSGLSLNQAPPIEVVLRLFFVGSLFGIVLSLMLFFWHNELANISGPHTLAIIHTFTLGVMASFMLGALFQMMPVLCGVHIKAPIDLSIRVYVTLSIGVIFLVTAFINSAASLYILASIFLGYSLLISAYVMIKQLLSIKHSNSSRGMLLALISLSITAILGIILVYIRAGFNLPFDYLAIKSIHYSFGLFGWIALLIISVAFQVVEMFYVTPKYSEKYAKYITIALFSLLLLYAIMKYLDLGVASIIPYILAIIVGINAAITLIKFKQKKRPINDASIFFWIVGMVSLMLFSITFLVGLPIFISAEFFAFFALSILFAMSYKIVPFLVWFHLNAKGYFDAPMMHEVISPKYAKINFWIYLSSIILFLIAIKFSIIFYIGSFLLLLSFCMLSYSIYRALEKYNFTLKYGKKFNF
jgi:hypothetical protein